MGSALKCLKVRFSSFFQALRLVKHNDSGSAAIEFVVLAIPLFLPILIFIANFSDVSQAEIQSRNLVREIVRAYVSSDSPSQAESNARFVMDIGAEKLGFNTAEIASMNLSFSCSGNPCLTPGEKVKGVLKLILPISSRQIEVSAQEYVSPWQ